MLTHEQLKAYWNKFGAAGYMPNGCLFVTDETTDISYVPPDGDEDGDTFVDRIRRSEAAGRNLFAEEWEPLDYSDGREY